MKNFYKHFEFKTPDHNLLLTEINKFSIQFIFWKYSAYKIVYG